MAPQLGLWVCALSSFLFLAGCAIHVPCDNVPACPAGCRPQTSTLPRHTPTYRRRADGYAGSGQSSAVASATSITLSGLQSCRAHPSPVVLYLFWWLL
ncbi:uncharacterized protein B0J16DRAFT_351682 [Fusarium flagelliforme]|uniref:uncharacterized protein n=1 Tax=Fusarium flagelliforme TaxID=2675880 RepID=UPI001E8D5B14|nr:uncharacterized protein B0J16DRAFT_351682 [Fusarium flagelliforme]KAH7169653.1 hypothetical protein B0J16DRAFT_351682 [Fusarium flagelliforme]